MDEHKFGEARELFKGPLAKEVGLQSGNAEFLRIRGDFWARTGEWQAAVTDFSELVRLEPDDHEGPYALAPLLVQTGKLEAYERFRGQILAHFTITTNDSSMTHRMGRVCLIRPAVGRELDAATRLADSSATLGKGLVNEPWCFFTKGLADFRRGRYADTVDWMRQVQVQVQNPVLGQGRLRHLTVQSYAVLAMAEYQLDHTQAAYAALATAVRTMQEEMDLSAQKRVGRGQQAAAVDLMQNDRPEGGDLSGGWREWLIANALVKEAERLIRPQASSR